MLKLERITLYPIKSLDGIEVNQARVLASGALAWDRQYAIVDSDGKYVNGKRTAEVHRVRASYDLTAGTVSLKIEGLDKEDRFHLEEDRGLLGQWLSTYFGSPVSLKRDLETGHPDSIPSYPGPTVISTATLARVAGWFDSITVDNMRARLRANLEISGGEAFWEDRLFAAQDVAVGFRIGEVLLEGGNPSQRCVVPTRDPRTGVVYEGFKEIFIENRHNTLPQWADRSRFNHYYRLSVNTRIPASQAGRMLHSDDAVAINGSG